MAGFSLTPAGPFSLAATGEFLGAAAPLAGTSAADEALRLVFPLDDLSGSGGAVLRETDGAVEGVATGPAAAVREQVARILSLDVDARGFVAVGEDDPVVGRLQRRFAGLRPPLFSMPFEAGCWALLSQRTQMRQAAALRQRLVEELGEPVDLEGGPLCAFPLPQRILELDRVAGLPGEKLLRLRGLAEAALEGDLDADRLRALDPDQALAELRRLRGLGPFSAELVLIRGSGAPDVLPLAEPRLRRAVVDAYGLERPPTDVELEELAERWRPFRSWVAFLLRRSVDSRPARSS